MVQNQRQSGGVERVMIFPLCHCSWVLLNLTAGDAEITNLVKKYFQYVSSALEMLFNFFGDRDKRLQDSFTGTKVMSAITLVD